MKYKIRFLKTNQDIEQAVAIIVENHGRKYEKPARAEIKEMSAVRLDPPRFFVAEENNKVIGLAGFCGAWFDYGIYEMFWVNVKKSHQGKGIGTALINRVIKEVKKEKSSKFIIITARIPKFYEDKFGFEKIKGLGEGKYMLIKKI